MGDGSGPAVLERDPRIESPQAIKESPLNAVSIAQPIIEHDRNTHPAETPFQQEFRKKLETTGLAFQPDGNVDEIDFPDETIQRLSTEDYFYYLDETNNLFYHDRKLLNRHFDTIVNRYQTERAAYVGKPFPYNLVVEKLDTLTTKSLETIEISPDVSSDVLADLYTHDGRGFETIGKAGFYSFEELVARIDRRNHENGHELGFQQYFDERYIPALQTETPEDNRRQSTAYVAKLYRYFPEKMPRFISTVFARLDSPGQLLDAVRQFSDYFSFEDIRQALREYTNKHPDLQGKLDAVDATLGLKEGEKNVLSVKDLYEKINFKEYKPNADLIEFEANLLDKELGSADRILDDGVGVGRHMEALKARGRSVIGIDYVEDHTKAIKDTDKASQAVVASWQELPFSNESFDAAYCLGRSALHNTTVSQWIGFLEEAGRVLKENGVFIIDLPDPTKGQYEYRRKQFAQAAQSGGITNFESGSIHDSPDDIHFMDRLAPMPLQFKAMAKLAGFDAQVIDEQDYQDPKDFTNTNMYWKLVKNNDWIGSDRESDLWDVIDGKYWSHDKVTREMLNDNTAYPFEKEVDDSDG